MKTNRLVVMPQPFAGLGLLLVSVLWLPLSFAKAADEELGQPVVSPGALHLNTRTWVKVSMITSGLKIKPGNIVVERIGDDGAKSILGTLRDDGQNGDALAGDYIYSGRIEMLEKKEGMIHLRVSARPEGRQDQILSPDYTMAVLPLGAPLTSVVPDLSKLSVDPRTGAEIIADEVLVCASPSINFKKMTVIARKIKGKVVGRFSEIGNCYQIKLPAGSTGKTVVAAIKKLEATPGVESAEPDHIVRGFSSRGR